MIRLVFALALMLCTSALFAETRVALVIGNSAYQNATPLPNPRNDSEAIAAKLTSIGFEVILREDLDGQGFRIALGEFSEAALNADIALFFYAGHGIELAGQNYLIPVDAKMRSEATAQFEAVPLEQVLSSVRSAKKLGMVMLDACRDNPFAAAMTRSNGTRSISRGLAPVSVEGEKGLLISFAAEAGRTAEDGDAAHSPYTEALLETIDQPGLEIGRIFRTVRAKVRDISGGRQVPIEQAQLPDEDLYLVNATSAPVTSTTTPVPSTTAAPALQDDPLLIYLDAVQKQDRAALEDFVRRYPDHLRAKDARSL
ncbi:MAG: caspase family protein, partial [Cypionkella sp.]